MMMYMKMVLNSTIVYLVAYRGEVANRIKINKSSAYTKGFLGTTLAISISLFPQNPGWLRQKQKHEEGVIGNQG